MEYLTISIEKDAAITGAKALNEALRTIVSTIRSVERKRTWRASEKAMTIAELHKRYYQIDHIKIVLELAAGVGG